MTIDVLVSISSVMFVAIVYLAITVARLSERIARLEERTRRNGEK